MSRSVSPAPRLSALRSVSRSSAGGPALTVAGIAQMRIRRSKCESRRGSSASGVSLSPPGSLRRPESRKPSVAVTGADGGRMSTMSISSVKPRNSQFGLLNISTPVGRSSVVSSRRSSRASRRGRMSTLAKRISICSHDRTSGSPPHREQNGWQSRQEKVADRISCLFNCHTMADVLFRIGVREIPAHKFIMGMASPVFYQSLFENRPERGYGGSQAHLCRVSILTDGAQTPGTQFSGSWSGGIPSGAFLRVSIDHYSFDAFFEFLRFLYTDDVIVTVGNVHQLVFMADEFKVPGLGERCFEFLRTEIRGDTVLRILAINRSLIAKAVVQEWKQVVNFRKVMNEWKSMSLAERRHHLQIMAPSNATSRANSRAGSARNSVAHSRAGSARNSVASLPDYATVVARGRQSVMSAAASTTSGYYDIYADSTHEDASIYSVTGNISMPKKQTGVFRQLALVSEEVNAKCWKCVRECTDAVITCSIWAQQPLRMVREILQLDVVSVPEIALFRAMNDWADKKCKSAGLPSLPEQRREALGEGTICMVRFPLLTLEQIQWEVVPTGLLTFKDIQSLQNNIAHKCPGLTKFSSEPRHYPITEIVNQYKRLSCKVQSPKPMSTRDSLRTFEDHSTLGGVMVPMNPVYNAEPGDEVDCLLQSHLLRGFVEQFTDEQESHLAAFEAGAKDGGEDTRATLCHSPMEGRRPSLLDRALGRLPSNAENGDTSSDPHQQKTLALGQMLMFKPSWLSQEMQENQQESSPERPASRGDSRTFAGKYTNPGDIPAPQDFARLSSGLYYFRGHQPLDMRIENGETMVYEYDLDDEDAPSENSFGAPTTEELMSLKYEEAIREELGIASKDLPKEKATLSNFLMRQ